MTSFMTPQWPLIEQKVDFNFPSKWLRFNTTIPVLAHLFPLLIPNYLPFPKKYLLIKASLLF